MPDREATVDTTSESVVSTTTRDVTTGERSTTEDTRTSITVFSAEARTLTRDESAAILAIKQQAGVLYDLFTDYDSVLTENEMENAKRRLMEAVQWAVYGLSKHY